MNIKGVAGLDIQPDIITFYCYVNFLTPTYVLFTLLRPFFRKNQNLRYNRVCWHLIRQFSGYFLCPTLVDCTIFYTAAVYSLVSVKCGVT
eukprot:UN01515